MQYSIAPCELCVMKSGGDQTQNFNVILTVRYRLHSQLQSRVQIGNSRGTEASRGRGSVANSPRSHNWAKFALTWHATAVHAGTTLYLWGTTTHLISELDNIETHLPNQNSVHVCSD